METGIANAVNRLKDELSKLRAGGRINTEVIEGLKVNLKTGSGNGNESVRLGELAQVVPRGGRMSAVLVSEEEVSTLYCLCVFYICVSEDDANVDDSTSNR